MSDRVPFDDWWDAYGKKRDRKACEAKYKKLSDKTTVEMLEHTIEYAKLEPNKQFRRDPIRYLRNENWKDEGFFDAIKERQESKADKNRGAWRQIFGDDQE